MNGKERVIRAIRCQDVDRVPWAPFVGCHAGAFLGVSAEEYLRSADLMVRGVGEAIRRYRPDAVRLERAFRPATESTVRGLNRWLLTKRGNGDDHVSLSEKT